MNPNIANRMQSITPFYVMELLDRAKQLQLQGRDIIHMEIGEPDFPTPKAVLEKGIQFLKKGEVKYSAGSGLIELRIAIAEHYWEEYAVKISPNRVFITPGASGALLLAFGLSINAKDKIMMADPCYPCNNNFLRLLDAEPQFINVDANTSFQLNSQLIEQNWNNMTKGVLIASPSNPTGTLLEDSELSKIISTVRKRGGFFYADEIYHGLVYDRKIKSALSFSQDVFVINSFSKFYGMTGWRIGWLIVPEAFIDEAEKLAQNIFISTATHTQHAALASFTSENKAELLFRRDEFKQRRDFLYSNLSRLGFKIPCQPEGAFYIYADCSMFCNDSFSFARELLENQGLAITPGKDFGYNQQHKYVRFAYTASKDRMFEALTRLEKFL